MAYDNDQKEPALPGGNNSIRRKSENHLPRYFRTSFNSKFLSSTLDQLIQPGVAEKLNGYIGRKATKAFLPSDNYVGAVSKSREDYQLEPAAVIKDNLNNIDFYKDYNDYINTIKFLGGNTDNHSNLNAQEFYTWNPNIDWDKFTNYREYYWLPAGPELLTVTGQAKGVTSTYTVELNDNVDNLTYIFNPDGQTNNPTLKLYRGQTYRFEINTPSYPIAFATKKSFTPGEAVIVETSDGIRSDGLFDLFFYDQDGTVYDAGGFIKDPVSQEEALASLQFGDAVNSSLIYETGITKTDADGNTISNVFIEKGIIEFTIPDTAPDKLYYISKNDPNVSGFIRIFDIDENTFLDVEKDIIGKKSYTTADGWTFSNGMKLEFAGEITPAKYASGQWYVEGVGDKIRLVSQNDLTVSGLFTDDIVVPFDNQEFDFFPFSEALGYPVNKDYIVINRASNDGNLWSRYNRWFHKDVIEETSRILGTNISIDESSRAKRPIIEFDPNIKLYNFGTRTKADVDLVDTFTKDIFTTIEGSQGYNIDGVNLTNGMRVLFTADEDLLVSGKIYTVRFINFKNKTQISLVEDTDSAPLENETVLVKFGTQYSGEFFFYNGTQWKQGQRKTKVNQQPLFELYDDTGKSFADTTVYNSTTFSGNNIFSYKVGTGATDSELGFALTYRSIENVGDIVYEFNLLQDSFTYQIGTDLFTKTTDTGYLRKYTDRTTFSYINGWTKSADLSTQNVLRQYIFDNTTSNFYIDVYDNNDFINDVWIRVYLNNKLLNQNIDFTVNQDANNRSYISFIQDLNLDDVILIKTRSKYPKNENGYYEIPTNLEKNPLNENLNEFTLGEVNDHVASIVEEINNFSGIFPGPSNLRDLGQLNIYGRKFLKHSGPINLSLYHLISDESNVVKALRFAKREYGKFKRQFLEVANTLGYEGPTKQHVDLILKEMNKDKTSSMPFYFSDMVPQGGFTTTAFEIEDIDEQFFALSQIFSLDELSRKAVQVYQNGIQLVHGIDYTFNSEGFAVVTSTKSIGDVIEIYEYDSTNGSFMPPTPTKLGIYPAYIPRIYNDSTTSNNIKVIEGHDGSKFVAFDDFRDNLLLELEKRIYNNIKIKYDPTLVDIHDFLSGDSRDTGFSKLQIDNPMTKDFLQWNQLVDGDYVTNSTFNRNNPFTWNYSNATSYAGGTLPGYWRQAYLRAYDTDRPHTNPWEMLGFSIKPTWWETQYGPAPYTRNNKLLWNDLRDGIVREPNKPIVVHPKYVRPNLYSILPVNDEGELLDPNASGVAVSFNPGDIPSNWKYGDGGPIESAWRRSSEYPFSVFISWILNQPNSIFSTGFDRQRQKRNLANQIVYGDTGIQTKLSNLIFPNTIEDTEQVFTSGLVNYVANYMTSNTTSSYTQYKSNLKSITNQIGAKIAGYSDKDKFRLILDSRTPTNEGNVFIPTENYQLILNTSSPIETINYSGVIIEKLINGYSISGYDDTNPSFTYYKPIKQKNDPVIDIGGVSQPFVNFAERKTYATGQIVFDNGSYYRAKETHTSETTLDTDKFVRLPALPTVGGRRATFSKIYENKKTVLNYGSVFSTIQEVVDFLLGYGQYLVAQGFVFEDRIENSNVVNDWNTTAKQFMFWTTQNWGAGALLTLSPGANKIILNTEFSVVDDIFHNFYGYSVLKADGKKLEPEFLRIEKGVDNKCTVRVVNTADGIYNIRLPLVQKEHVVLLDNKTVFDDIIYDAAPGYRQERIKVLGYRTDNWNGSLNIPGFIYDNARPTEWEAWKDYSIGDLVKYKEFFYSADKKVSGKEFFDSDDWNRLAKEPIPGLLTNFDYKINQFADFYDLDSDNFDTEQQRLAQHLIGYQKRQYLENIINDDVSQYKFYQGFILDKGTKNALNKLFDALASANQDSLSFYEEWAVKDGQYGASEGFEEVEYTLDENKFRLDPQPVLLTNEGQQETDLVYRIKEYETYLKSNNYDHSPFPTTYISKGYTKDAGFVNPENVDVTVGVYDDILNLNFVDIKNQGYVWVQNYNKTWTVLQHTISDYTIESITPGSNEFTVKVDKTPLDINTGDILGITDVTVTSFNPAGPDDSTLLLSQTTDPLEGFFKVKSVSLNNIVFESTDSVNEIEKCSGLITKLISVRQEDITSANILAEQEISKNEKIWIDDAGNGKWAVLENKNSFDPLQEISNTETGTGHNYGASIAADDRNVIMAVGAPSNEDGKVFVYNRASNSLNYQLQQVLEPTANISAAEQKFGYSVSLSEDGKYLLVGAPEASNVRTDFKETFDGSTNYDAGDIVRLNNSLWQADIDILGAVTNIEFSSFDSVAQINYDLNLIGQDSEKIPVLLTGDYPFKNITTDHFLVKAPKDMYGGSGVDDKLFLRWNSFANANQTQINLTSLAPFAGTVPHIDKQFIESAHTIFYKVDAILFVDASNNIPQIGDTVTTAGATGNVIYTHNEDAQVTIYVNDVNGEFPRENSLFIDGNDFVGEYERVGPGEETDTSQKYGGYWFIRTGENYQVGETNSDPALGLVYTDIISEISGGDSTSSGNYYYQSLDYQTNVQSSENVLNNFIQTLSFQGSPGPFGNTDPILSRKFVVRVPADLSSDPAVTIGSEVELYVNNLPDTTTTISFTNPIDLVANEVLVQANTGASVRVLETVTNSLTVKVDTVIGNFNTADLLSGSTSGALGVRPTNVPVVGFLDDPNNIGLTFDQTNKTQTIVDVWDGYISYRSTKFLNGEPFEPLVGQTVRDVSTLATAEVVYYQRSLNDVTIWVKNVSGNWSNGNQFADNAEIEFLPFPSGPDPDVYGRPGIYTVPRVIGQIQRVSLGLPSAGIGKMFVFETTSNIPLVSGDFRTASQLGGTPVINPVTSTFSYFESNNNFEYWLYKEGTVLGIAREANTPNANNLDWTEVYIIPTSTSGSSSSFNNEGIYYVYQKNTGGRFELINSYISPDRSDNQYFGTKVAVTKNANNLYRGFINAPGQQNLSDPGKIYFIKNGTENNITYNWEYAKNKNFKGEFDDTQRYYVGDIVYLGNRLYNAATNINPGPFNNLEWDSTDDLIDYVGYVPNDTGLTVVTDSSYTVENPYDPTQLQAGDSTVLDQSNLVEFGSQYDVSKNGEVLVVAAKYSDKPNLAVVYRNVQGQYVWSQQISAPSVTEAYGDQIAISNDGKLLAVSAPLDDTTKNNQGKIYIYRQVNGAFEYSQTLNSPLNNTFEFFGNTIDFDGNRLLVNAKNGDNKEFVTFDVHSDILEGRVLDKTSKLNDSATTFDQGFTNFSKEFEDQGSAYIYENINGKLIYAQSLKYQPQDEDNDNPLYSFGRNIHLKNNHAYVGLPKVSSNTLYVGTVVDFRLPDNKNVYEYLSLPKDPVNVQKIKRVILYNTKTNNLLTYLDYIDPIQGKVAGAAEENLRYKTYYDPAVYSVGNSDSVVVNPVNSWGPDQVGQLWWNLTNAKFLNPYQSNVIYSANNWNTLAQGSSIDIYEWVESTVLPSVWDASVDQDESNAAGIDGTSVYGDAIYSTRQVYDDISQSLQTRYYFWVQNKRTLPDKEFRTLSSQAVAELIEDPKGQGYRYATLISDNSFAVYNCDNLLEGKDVAIGIQYWTIDNQNINIHNQYQIITEGLETSRPNRDIERKWFDSLIGYDEQGRQVPAPNLSPKVKYGILNSPRQSWFENKSEALKQLIERVNGVLKTNLIVDNKDFTRLLTRDPEPSLASRRYDTTANTVADLEFIGVAKAQQATMTLQITDGVITKVNVLNPGRGYLQAPTYKITGTGSGAELEFTINNLGVVTNVNVLKGGSNYSDTDTITIRKYTVLVENDETIQGKWALYERDSERRIWQRIASQAFDTSLYWDYIDWYANGFNQFTETNFVIDNAYELQGLDDSLGDIIKINNIGTGGWLLLRKIDVQDDVDYTVNYETIGRQNGTIKFKSTLYDTRASAVGFDIVSFDSQFYDSVPSTEIRNILTSIKEDLYTEELSIEYNRLFFASLRYVFSEQNYVDWAFKTSFVKARHNVGELREDITFNNDSLPSYEKYLEEVKPFKTKLREYVSAYEKTEDTNSRITDFDLQPSFNNNTNQIEPQNVKLIDNNLIGINDKLNSYPYKNWTDNVGFKVTSIEIADGGQGYQVAPTIRLSGGGGTGASALAKLGANGRISKIEVTSQGAGYLSAPSIEIVGSINEGGRAAKASVIIGESLPRSITNKIKYDRVSGVDFITTLNETETFIGTGSKYIFDLKWPMDLKNINVEVLVNNILLLRSEYKFSNQKDTTKGYTRYKGRIELTEPATNGISIVVNYKKDINLLTAADRINLAYNPETGQFAKDLGQLMDGVDYGGVEVKSFDFGGPNGWDTGPWFTSEYDTYDTTFEDETFELDGSTISIQLSKPLENSVEYNIYLNGVRIDDPNFGTGNPVSNPNAICQSITGDGVQTTIFLDNDGLNINGEGSSLDPEYNNGALIAENNGTVFDRALTVNGLKLVVAGAVGGQLAVPDEWALKTARTFELMTDPNGAGINTTHQRNFLKTLKGDAGTKHAGIPTVQRVGYGGGSTYTPNWLEDAGIPSYAGLQAFNDSVAQKDMVWYRNINGNNPPTQRRDIEEIFEHIFHTIHAFGIPGAVPGSSDAVEMNPDIRIENEPSFDWKNTALHLAMKEAIDAGLYDPSGYSTDWNTDPEAAAVAYTEYTYLVNWSMWDMSVYWDGGSLSPEWDDSLKTPAGMLANNPLGYALFNTYFAPVLSKPDFATIESIFGENDTGVSGYVVDVISSGDEVGAGDTIIIRKSTSDGSFLPLPGSYDTLLTGGDLNYTNAQGISAEAINIDGDGFFTPINSGGPDEQLPGRVFDAVDIKVYEKPVGGSSQIVSRNYTGDGTTKLFDIGTSPIVETNLFVKIGYSIQKAGTDYTVNYDTKQIEFTTAPSQGDRVSLITLETSGTNILDIDEFVADGSSIDFLTNITYTENLSSLVTIDGKEIPHSLVKSNETYASPNKIIIRFAEVPTIDKIVRFAIFEGQVQNYSTVTVDTFESDGSTTAYTLSQTPFAQAPNEWQTIVTINDTVLNAGYNQTFTLTNAKEYQLKLWQVPTASLSAEQVKVYLNGTELTYLQQWTFSSSESFDITQPLSAQVGSSVTLAEDVGVAGDTLKIYIFGWDDSTQSGGDYRYGYFDNQGEFVRTPGTLYINKNYSVGDIIKVYQFSNHDSQGIDRQSYDVVERTLLNQGVTRGTQSFELDGSTANLNLVPALTVGKYYAVYFNNIRIDDPNYGTSNPVTNPNAVMKTILGAEQTVLDLQILGITTSAGDYIQLAEIGGDVIPDAGTADWYELRQLRNGYINLRSEAVDDQYVWVMKNGSLLTPSVDYHVTPDRLRVKLLETLTENDTVETFHFANSQLKNKFGWRQFKDILNRNIYKRLDGSKNFTLADPLYWYDKQISVVDATLLPDPVPGSKYPAIIFIEGERIEYFRKDGNKLKQLRRGTLGTGVKEMYEAGIEIYDQSATATVPYKDETLSTIFTADGTSNIYELDFTPEKPYYGEIVDTFEVFVAGRRLRKNAVSSYQLDNNLRDTYAAADQTINQDSPEGDITLPAEFSIQNGNELVLLDTPLENQKVIVVRNQGKTWTESGQRLADASSNIAKFLQAVQVDLPG